MLLLFTLLSLLSYPSLSRASWRYSSLGCSLVVPRLHCCTSAPTHDWRRASAAPPSAPPALCTRCVLPPPRFPKNDRHRTRSCAPVKNISCCFRTSPQPPVVLPKIRVPRRGSSRTSTSRVRWKMYAPTSNGMMVCLLSVRSAGPDCHDARFLSDK